MKTLMMYITAAAMLVSTVGCQCTNGILCRSGCETSQCKSGACGNDPCSCGHRGHGLLGHHGNGLLGHHGNGLLGHQGRHQQSQGLAGPATGTVTYPYYTVRGPRDFFLDNPPSIGR